MQAIRLIRDTAGEPILFEDAEADTPLSMLGYPIFVEPDISAPGANAKSVACGDGNRGYVIRRVTGLSVPG